MSNDMKQIEITTSTALWDWLEKNHSSPDSVQLITWKAASPDKYVSQDDVLDALVAFGWIDGRRFKVDDQRTSQLISPRKQQAWSKTYKERADKLLAEGRMHPAGRLAISDSKAAGMWDYYADVDALVVPDDLGQFIDHSKWESLAPSYRRNVLRWIDKAKTPASRAKRITATCLATASDMKLPQM